MPTNRKLTKNSHFPLARVKALAADLAIKTKGRTASTNVDTYFGGIRGLAAVIAQLEDEDFRQTKTDDLPNGYEFADDYLICTDSDFKRQKTNNHDMGLTVYYLKFAIQDDLVVVMFSNHPSR